MIKVVDGLIKAENVKDVWKDVTMVEDIVRMSLDGLITDRMEYKDFYGMSGFISDFRTLKFIFPRQTGKTTTIANLHGEDDLIVSRTLSMMKDFRKRRYINCDMVTESTFCNGEFVHKKPYRIIWFDECTMDHKMGISRLIDLGTINSETVIVKIGTRV